MDTVILNPRISLELFLPPSDRTDIHFMATKDNNGLNSGLFYIRVSEWSIAFLSSVLSWPVQHADKKVIFADQSAMSEELQSKPAFAKGFQQIPRNWINAYGSLEFDGHITGHELSVIRPGYFVLHLPGPAKTFRPWFDQYLDIAERHEAKWELDPAVSGLDKEVKAFWQDLPKEIVQRR